MRGSKKEKGRRVRGLTFRDKDGKKIRPKELGSAYNSLRKKHAEVSHVAGKLTAFLLATREELNNLRDSLVEVRDGDNPTLDKKEIGDIVECLNIVLTPLEKIEVETKGEKVDTSQAKEHEESEDA